MKKMLSYENSGFSLDAKVKIEAFDKDGLERLIRYCARPPFKSENIRVHNSLINYRLPKASHDGRLFMTLDPLDFVKGGKRGPDSAITKGGRTPKGGRTLRLCDSGFHLFFKDLEINHLSLLSS